MRTVLVRVGVALGFALSICLPVWSFAQGLSGASTTGSTCAGPGNNADGFTGCSVSLPVNNANQVRSRYAFNVSADIGIFSTRDQSGTATHRLAFNATAPLQYQVTITSNRVGDVNRVSDASGCEGSASLGAMTGSSNIALTNGSLSLTDGPSLGVGGSTTSKPFNNTTTATIIRSSSGVAQSHVLTFTWSASARSNSCEAAIRMGENSGTVTGCSACAYPGSPSRTQANDGHFVTVDFLSFCGNGVVETARGEVCDDGPNNGSLTGCCSASCQPQRVGLECRSVSAGDDCDVAENCASNGTCPADGVRPSTYTCRTASGACDVAENCNGSSKQCPADAVRPSTFVCRSAVSTCDAQEFCNGSSKNCPADAFAPAGTTCRSAAGVCDLTEVCTGTSNACPADGKSTGICRPSAGPCDSTEFCNGVSNNCPTDTFLPNTFTCRSSAGVCDIEEKCTGTSAPCPSDAFASSSTVCRLASSGEECDVTENCTGTSASCPADAVRPAGFVCRSAAGPCDVQETCDGNVANKDCPADAFVSSSTVCRSSGGVCDLAENCTGTSAACPPDAKRPSTFVCRSSAAACDAAETCTGTSNTCPADAVAPAGTVCRSSTGMCDVAETCNGTSITCPADGFASSSTVCRSSAGVCDVAENCTGSSASCPTDSFQPSTVECRMASAGNTCDLAENCTGTNASCPPDGGLPDGSACTDFDPLTNPDTCQGNICVGGGTATPTKTSTPSGPTPTPTPGGPAISCSVAPPSGCITPVEPSAAQLQIKYDPAAATKGQIKWKWKKGGETLVTDWGNPLSGGTTSYAFCLYEDTTLIYEATVPAGAGWSASTKGPKYKDKALSQEGVNKIGLKAGPAGKAKIGLKAKNKSNTMTLTTPPAYTGTALGAYLVNSEGKCWSATFNVSGATNSNGQFKGKSN